MFPKDEMLQRPLCTRPLMPMETVEAAKEGREGTLNKLDQAVHGQEGHWKHGTE